VDALCFNFLQITSIVSINSFLIYITILIVSLSSSTLILSGVHADPLCILQLSMQINLEDKRKENRLSLLYRIIQHQEPALDIPSYYTPQTSTTRQSNAQHFILPTVTPFITRPATSSEQLKNGTSCHHQCMMNLNFKLHKLAILIAYLFLDVYQHLLKLFPI